MQTEKPEIMTAQEVAEFLRISERTVYDWAASGTIPAGKLGTTWRFKRSEIEKWVNEQLSTTFRKKVAFSTIDLKNILNPNHIIVMETSNKDIALMSIIDNLASSGAISDKEAVIDGIFQREKLMSTGIGLGIGIPHIRLGSISDLVIAVGVSTLDITDYESLDGKPVRIIFMILAGKDQHALHIKTMAAISARLKDPLLRERLILARDPKIIHSLLTDGEK